jgi:hypothetical protein
LWACGGREALLVAGREERILAEAPGGPEAGWPPEVRPHPEQVKTSESTQPTTASATWCLTMPLDFLQVTLPIPHIITSRQQIPGDYLSGDLGGTSSFR